MKRIFRSLLIAVILAAVVSCNERRHEGVPPVTSSGGGTNIQMFLVKGVVRQLRPDGRTIVVRHEDIPNYMAAMTMPFHVKDTNELSAIRSGDEITFRLSVTGDESWIDYLRKTGRAFPVTAQPAAAPPTNAPAESINLIDALSTYVFTNEFGRAVRFSEFKGRAVGFTFFFTRCPLPEYCPRLTKNFVGATEKLKSMTGAPTNWHFLSISFDAEFDTPALLKSYARTYGYDSNHWSFLTASPATIREVTAGFGFNARPSANGFDHNFLTVVVDANGFLQSAWPVGGDTTDNLVGEILKAAAPANRPPGK